MSRLRKASPSGLTIAYDALTLEFERHEALTLLLQTHLATFDGDKCEDKEIHEEIFATSVLASVLLEQIKGIRDLGRVLWECGDGSRTRRGAMKGNHSAQKNAPPMATIEDAQPFDPGIAAEAISRWLPEGLQINSPVWSEVHQLVNGRNLCASPLFPDSRALWDEQHAVSRQIQETMGHKFFNRYEKAGFHMRGRLVQAAFAAGWVSRTRQLEPLKVEIENLRDAVEVVADLATMLITVFDAIEALGVGVEIQGSIPGFMGVIELMRTKAQQVDGGLERIADEVTP